MVKNRLFRLIVLTFLMGIFSGCSPRWQNRKPVKNTEKRYYDAYPDGDVAAGLEKIARSVFKVNGIAFYKTYYFTRKQGVDDGKMKNPSTYQTASYQLVTHKSSMGTATLIYHNERMAALISCAHIVHFDDTLTTYFADQPDKIYSISIRLKQNIFVSGFNNNRAVVVAKDKTKDLALLKMELSDTHKAQSLLKMTYPIGKTKDLQWGSFIYAMGFPMGQKMVTRGVVSLSKNNRQHYILSDAVFNGGYSGAPVFSLRGGAPHFEWIGMVRSGAVEKMLYVQPRIKDDQLYSKNENYSGEVFVNNKVLIKYGLTYTIPIEEIVMFVHHHQDEMRAAGFQPEIIF